MDIRPVSPRSADARRLLADYLDDLERRFDGWTKAGYVDAPPEELMPPAGALLWRTTAARPWPAAPST